jgi:hypothetical protein
MLSEVQEHCHLGCEQEELRLLVFGLSHVQHLAQL